MEHAKSFLFLKRMTVVLLVISLGACSSLSKNRMSADDRIAHDFRGNVVRIETQWKNGSTHKGFGFVVGERGGRLYIATANHVLRDIEKFSPAAVAESISVYFFTDSDSYTGELLGVSDRINDVGGISTVKPAGFSWEKKFLSKNRAVRGTEVRFVGKGGKWEIPATPGVVKGQESPWFLIEGLSVAEGTSGAPLVSAAGLVGMVVSDSFSVSKALPILAIEDILKNHIPWQLSAMEVQNPQEVTNSLGLVGGVLGAVALGVLVFGNGGGSDTGSINVTAPTP